MEKEIEKKLIDICYETGLKEFKSRVGKKQNEGYKKILLAADAGLKEAQEKVGEIFDFGNGRGTWDLAVKYFKMASEQGSAFADYCLSVCFYRTRWEEKESTTNEETGESLMSLKVKTAGNVEEYLKKSAEANYFPAQFLLGKELLFGNDIMKADKKEGKKWLELASKNGVEEATELLKENF